MHKETAKKYYLDFIDEPENSERRKYNRSIHTTYSFGNGHKSVRFILLDVRFHKQSYYKDIDPDIIDEEQWVWLETILAENDETFTFIGSGTQILPFNRLFTEAWFEKSRKRLFNLLGKLKKSGVIILSGDVHYAEILKTYCTLPEIGYDLIEITSSGMTHYVPQYLTDIVLNRDYRISESVNYYNFAKLDFEWGTKREEAAFNVRIIDLDNITRIEKKIRYSELTFDVRKTKDSNCYNRLVKRFKTFSEYVDYYQVYPLELVNIILFYLFISSVLALIIYIPIKILILIIYFLKKVIMRTKSVKKE